MIDLTEFLVTKLKDFQSQKGGTIDVHDPEVVAALKCVIESYVEETDEYVYEQVRKIAAKIEKAKQEVMESISDGSVDEAALELDSVLESTENAANAIMDAVEAIQNKLETIENEEVKTELETECMKIFEACNFQDLTGQRITKVVGMIKEIDEALKSLIGTLTPEEAKKRRDEKLATLDADSLLMNGPQLEGKAPTQEEIDKLFES